MHPTYTFRVNLLLLSNEAVGPNTNSLSTGVLSPDQYQTSPDYGRIENSNRVNTLSSWFPDLLRGNRQLKHGDTFEESGLKALYLRNMYTTGYAPADRAFLEII